MTSSLLLCGDPSRPGRCDPYFAPQAAAARQAGAAVALLDHDALLAGRVAEAVRRVPHGLGTVWYRGWMVPATAYARLGRALDGRGGTLATSPAAYRTAHELPGWYGTFAEVTPASAWTACEPFRAPAPAALARTAAALPAGPGIVKDFVKSRKHEWDQACYVPDLADTASVHRVVSRFVELQEDALAGGVVLRAFEDLDRAAGEARVWWLDGEPLLTTAHPDTPGRRPRPALDEIRPLVGALGCRFVTTDLARRADGVWRVIEVGDGQVSDLPAGIPPADLLVPLLAAPPEGVVSKAPPDGAVPTDPPDEGSSTAPPDGTTASGEEAVNRVPELDTAAVEALARRVHAGQTDKAGRPYAEHLAAVAAGVAAHGGSREQIAAAWLHDAVEDGRLSREWLAASALPRAVKDIVLAVTKLPGEDPREYAERILAVPGARLVKEADLAHNSDPARLAVLGPATRERLTAKYGRIRALLGPG